ncbi:hypothetical protein diail_3836 [Diaporthe ilicicola]|nr:hypothetical protein diail_3836 [Diaporthe ilicicola]
MTSKLLEVPAEILACIADELDIEHYGNLRLASRQMDEYTFPYFAKKFFGRRKFFRGYLSLSTLLSISESRLSPYMETLVLGTELLESGAPTDAPRVSKERYVQAYADQTSLLASGWDRDTLVAAMRNLPNLKGVAVESFDDREVWDFEANAPNSVIDGGYGLKTLLRDLGYEAGRPPCQASPVLQCVAAVQMLLGAVARAGAARPGALTIAGKVNNGSYMSSDGLGVDDDAFNITPFMEQTVVPVVEGLEELDLEVHNRVIYPSHDDPASCRTCHLRRFLGLPKRLQKLRIARLTGGMQPLENTEEKDGFWAWMGASAKGKGKEAAPQSVQEEDDDDDSGAEAAHQWNLTPINAANPLTSPPPIPFPHLRELHLAEQDILAANLTRLLRKVSPTLVKLDLRDLILRDRAALEAEVPPVAADADADADEGDGALADEVRTEVALWVRVCERLAAMPCDELREIRLGGFGGLGSWHCAKFGVGRSTAPESVHFRALRMVGEDAYDAKAEFSYRGPDVPGALGLLVADLRAAVRDGRHVFVAEPAKRRNSF